MHGDSISRKCFDWMVKNENLSNDSTSTNALDELVVEAIDCFDVAMQYGDIGHSALSTLDLLMAYLKYIFRMKGYRLQTIFISLTLFNFNIKALLKTILIY